MSNSGNDKTFIVTDRLYDVDMLPKLTFAAHGWSISVVDAVHGVHPSDKRLTVHFRTIDGRNSATNIRSNEATPADRVASGRPRREEVECRRNWKWGKGKGAPTHAEFSTRLVLADAVRRSAMWNMICRSEKCERSRV